MKYLVACRGAGALFTAESAEAAVMLAKSQFPGRGPFRPYPANQEDQKAFAKPRVAGVQPRRPRNVERHLPFTQRVRNDESVHLTEKNRHRVGKLDGGKTKGATSVTKYSKVDRGTQEHDAIDFPCAEPALANYYKQGLSPHPMPLRRRRSAPGRSADSLSRPPTSEPLAEEVKRQWREIAELRVVV